MRRWPARSSSTARTPCSCGSRSGCCRSTPCRSRTSRGELELAPATAAPAEPLGFALPAGRRSWIPRCRSASTPLPASRSASAPRARFVTGRVRPADPDLDGLMLLDFAGLDALVRGGRALSSAIRATSSAARDPPQLAHQYARARRRRCSPRAPGRNCCSSTRSSPSAPICRPRTSSSPLQPSATRTRCPYKGEAVLLVGRARRPHDRRSRLELPGAARRRAPRSPGSSASSTNASTSASAAGRSRDHGPGWSEASA